LSLDLHLDLERDTAGASGLRSTVEDALREAIRSGRLARGSRLPPTRGLARDLGVSRGTVFDAYAQLAAEGWILSAQGSGTFVAAEPAAAPAPAAERARDPHPLYDMSSVTPDLGSFPRAEWIRALRRAVSTAPHSSFGYTDPGGIDELRVEIAGYLCRFRGLQVTADNIVMTTGYTQSLNLVVRTIDAGRVAMEDPSHKGHHAIVRGAGHRIVPMRVDDEGADVAAVQDADLAVLTPNRHHLLGVTLSAARRADLLDWARRTDSFVVENDYDGEFRYDSRPLSALQSLEPTRVVYAGTTSKSLAPGLRIGWLAAPEPLVGPLSDLKLRLDTQNPVLEQLAFAEFLRTGGYDRHIRRQRLRYRQRRDRLLAALPPGLRVSGQSAGLSLTIHLPDVETERRVVARAAGLGLALQGLASDDCYLGDPQPGLVVGYAAPPDHSFDATVATLVRALRD
jgi:GntR family transcriptional regulator/MocR family aminotransferase